MFRSALNRSLNLGKQSFVSSTVSTNSCRCFNTENLDDQVSNKVPSIVWNADLLHGLTKEQIEFRQNVRAFFEKELPEELVRKVCFS